MTSRMDPRRMDRRMRTIVAVAVAAIAAIVGLLLMRSCAPEDVTVIAVGDMVCSPLTDPNYNDGAGQNGECEARAVSDAAVEIGADYLWGLGDYQHELPSAEDYSTAYDPTWGRLREITRPALGNQELKVHQANTFYDYFGELAGPRSGYYSYQAGAWHVVVLNTNCTTVAGGCGPESQQVEWLRADLEASGARCVAAYGHHPRWSNGIAGPDVDVATIFDVLVENGVALYLSGHEADYERFGPLDSGGQPDPAGTVQFVVGTGGQAVYEPQEGDAPWRDKAEPLPSEFFQATDHGFLVLDLMSDSYSWAFHGVVGGVVDEGTATCPER